MRGNAELARVLDLGDVIVLPTVVLGELHYGFAAGSRKDDNERLLMDFLRLPGVVIQDVTWDVARRYGLLAAELRAAGTPIPHNDVWIAATALNLGACLITYDAHFSGIPGLLIESPA